MVAMIHILQRLPFFLRFAPFIHDHVAGGITGTNRHGKINFGAIENARTDNAAPRTEVWTTRDLIVFFYFCCNSYVPAFQQVRTGTYSCSSSIDAV